MGTHKFAEAGIGKVVLGQWQCVRRVGSGRREVVWLPGARRFDRLCKPLPRLVARASARPLADSVRLLRAQARATERLHLWPQSRLTSTENVYIIPGMRQASFVTYRLPSSSEWRYAVRSGSRLADFTALGFDGTTRDLLRLGADRIEQLLGRAAQTAEAWQEIDRLNGITFGPPVPDPDKVLCIGLNYREHAREAGLPIPPVPVVFAKFRNSLIGAG
jgi:hypothetical protein